MYSWYLFRLVGDVLIGTGFLSYSGPFNQAFRTRLRETWEKVLLDKSIPYSDGLNIIEMLVDNATVGFSDRRTDCLIKTYIFENSY